MFLTCYFGISILEKGNSTVTPTLRLWPFSLDIYFMFTIY